MRTLRVYYSAPVAETAVGCFPGAAFSGLYCAERQNVALFCGPATGLVGWTGVW